MPFRAQELRFWFLMIVDNAGQVPINAIIDVQSVVMQARAASNHIASQGECGACEESARLSNDLDIWWEELVHRLREYSGGMIKCV